MSEAYCTRVTFRLYAEETNDAANKVSQRPEARSRRAHSKLNFTLPVITACKVVTYKRIGIILLFSYLLVFLVQLHPHQLFVSLAFWVLLHPPQMVAF